MDDTLIAAREIDLNKKVYLSIKTNLITEKDFHNAMDGNVNNGGKYEYRLYKDPYASLLQVRLYCRPLLGTPKL